MNPPSSNLLTSYQMVSRLCDVYLLSFCLTGLYDESISNLCSITSLGILGISNICHIKISRFSQRKVISMSSYLESRHVLTRNFFSGSLTSARTLQLPSSSDPSTDRWATGLTLRCHMCPSWLTAVEGSRSSMA
jgi:hypothetical protein